MDINKWPVGGARLETIGNIVYGLLCSTSFTLVCADYSFRILVRMLVLRPYKF